MQLNLPKCRHLVVLMTLLLAFNASASEVRWEEIDNPKVNPNRTNVAAAFAKLPERQQMDIVRRLYDALTSPGFEVRWHAALVLGELGDKTGVPVMARALATPDRNQRSRAIVALRVLKAEAAIPALRGALKDKEPYVRSIALSALGEIKATEAFDDIVRHLRDYEEERVTCFPSAPVGSAIYALGALGDKKAIPLLMQLLDEKEFPHFYIGDIAQALGQLTGEKFGYDMDKWKAWWKAQQ